LSATVYPYFLCASYKDIAEGIIIVVEKIINSKKLRCY